MKLEIRRHECMLLALLRASLKEEKAEIAAFENCTPEDWENCYRISAEQGVMALAWDGVSTLPENLMPPMILKLRWALAVEKQEKIYEHFCSTVSELTELFATHGIGTTQLKGVGLSTYYPIPTHREGGDIDIYTYATDRSKMTDLEANALADDLIEKKGITVKRENKKHSVFHYNGITIENHKVFLSIKDLDLIHEVHAVLKQYSLEEEALLMNGKYRIHIPDYHFNSVYIPVHAAQHYDGALALHHLCDWACILRRHGLQIPKEIHDKHFFRIITALTSFTNRYLGSDIKEYNSEKECKRTFREIFRNHEKRKAHPANRIGYFFYRIKWSFYNANVRKWFFGEPIHLYFYRAFQRHLK